jgi:hypothetical protein
MSTGEQNMKTEPDALGTAENKSGRGKHENGTPSEPPKTSLVAQNMKTGPDTLGIAENESERAYMKTGPDAVCTAKNESGRAKHEKGTQGPRYRRKLGRESKTSAENMKTGLNALENAENECGRAKHENETRHPRYRRKRVLGSKTLKRETTHSIPLKTSSDVQNMKMGPDALGTAENVSGSA